MSDPFVGEIRIFPYNFAPLGWAVCDGRELPTGQYSALFDVIGTTYGGDGQATFAIPNLLGRAPMHPGQGPGLSLRTLGDSNGVENVTLLNGQMPAHRHAVQASSATGDVSEPDSTVVLAAPASGLAYKDTGTLTAMGNILTSTGGGQPHNNMQPYLVLQFCIALQGIFPPPT